VSSGSGFHFASAQRNPEKKTSCLLYSSFTMTRMRANRGEFQMRRNRVTQSQGSSGLVNEFSRIQDPVRVKCVFELAKQLTHDIRRRVRPPAFLRQTDSVLARIWNGVRSKRRERESSRVIR
jgi:hypothetical protein